MMAGGGSGGHVYPLIAIAEALEIQAKAAGQAVDIAFVGDGVLIEQSAHELGLPFYRVIAPKWRRYVSILNILDLFKIPFGIAQACIKVWYFMPDVMLVKGGYASFLPALAAKLMAIPLVVHESDSIPGKVNLWWGKMARRVFLSFEHARQYFRADRSEVIGNPIRTTITTPIDRDAALASFGFQEDKPIVLITGGSQGAAAINELIVTDIIEFVKKFYVIHQTGPANFEALKKQVEGIIKEEEKTFGAELRRSYRYYASFSEKEMAYAYAAADVVVSRAGSALFEIAAVGKPAIIIPLTNAANDHQVTNAREFAQHGGIMIEQDNLTPHILINEILVAYGNRVELGANIRAFARPEAAAKVAQELLAAAQ